MPKKIADNRNCKKMTEADADLLMQKIAELTLALEKTNAATEVKIATLKAFAAEANAPRQEQIKAYEAELAAYITAHPERFVKPRARKTHFGSYGLRSVSNLTIKDEALLLAYAKIHDLCDLYTVVEKLDKKAVEKALKENQLPADCGAAIVSGEVASYTVSKAFIAQNLESAK